MWCLSQRTWLLFRVLSEGWTAVKKADPHLILGVFIGISALKKEGMKTEKAHALYPPSPGTKWATLPTPMSFWAFLPLPHEGQIVSLSESSKQQSQQLDVPVLPRFTFSKGKSKYFMTSKGLFPTAWDKRQGTGWRRVFFCGLNSAHLSKEGVNVLPGSHPCESHLFNLMRKLTVHCDQQSLSCSAPPRSYKTARFALILGYLQLERMETEGTQLNLKKDAFLSDLAFTIDRGTQTCLTGYTRHLAAWQSFVPHRDQSKQQRDLSGKRGISCFLPV